MKKTSFCLLYGFLLLLASCGGSSKFDHPDKMVFRYNESAGISSLDPAFSRNLENLWAANMLFSSLVQLNDSLQIEPCIASAWEISEDGKQYTFHLRDDVFFHDSEVFPDSAGRKVSAADFVYSFERIMDKTLASPGSWVFSYVSAEEPFVAVDDSTLVIHLRKQYPPFLGILSMKYCAVVPREAIEFYGDDFREHPVGTGPFKFNFWIENTRLALLKNENYFERDEAGERLPYLDAVAVSFVPDKSAAFMGLLKGNYDFMSGLHSSYANELLTPEGLLNPAYAENLYLVKQPFLKTDYLAFLVDSTPATSAHPALLKTKVRQAINYAIDKKAMVRFLRRNIVEPANAGFIPYGMPAHGEGSIGYSYNPARAAELLAEAGYPGGKGIEPFTLATTSDYADLCEFVQHQLSEIGIRIKVDVLPASVHREYSAKGDLLFFRKSWLADYPDAENFLALFFSGNFAPNGPNYTHYSSSQFDALYARAMRETNDAERIPLYRQMDSLMMVSAPIVPLYYDKVVRFVNRRVSGLDKNPMNLLDLRRVKMDQREEAGR